MLRFSGKFVREFYKFRIVARSFSSNNNIVVSEEVRSALKQNKPVVALESTIITHGMPYPENIKCALEVEEMVRAQNAVPATIAIIKGEIKVGLNQQELNVLGDVQKSNPIKTSRRDLAYVVSNYLNGGTTVSGTIIVASKVGIPIFATGGIGGVHREGETTFDVSADLPELGRNNVAVVSSGVKSILDIPKTLEYLETQGVFVATFGDTADFPAFYCRKSGFQVPYRVQTIRQAAEIIHANHELNMQSGMLFAVPVPEEFALDENLVDGVVEKALKTAKREGISGKRITPFLLAKIAQITAGKSLETNMALIKNNAKIAAGIAVELSRLKGRKVASTPPNGGPVVIGGSNLDCSVKLADPALKMDGRIHSAKHFLSAGGVARNICEALSKLGKPPSLFISVLGDDQQGKILRTSIPYENSDQLTTFRGAHTAQCTSIFDPKGDLYFLLGDMDIHSKITPEMIGAKEDVIKKAPLIIFDANLTVPTIAKILELAYVHNVPVFFEPTDVVISSKPFETDYWKAVKFISPNLNEIRHIAGHLKITLRENYQNKIAEAAEIAGKLVDYVENVFVTLGDDGLIIARRGSATDSLLSNNLKQRSVRVRHYPVKKVEECVNVSGAGDSLASGLVVAMMEGLSEERCVSVGFAAAQTALFSSAAVAPTLFDKNHKSWLEVAKYNTLS